MGRSRDPSDPEKQMEEFIKSNIDLYITELDQRFTRDELHRGIKALKNNKASCFDRINNEMIKCCGPRMGNAI